MMARRRPADFARSLLVTGTPPCSKTSVATTSVSSTPPSPQIRRNSAIRDRIARRMPRARAQRPSPHGSGVVTRARVDLAGLRIADRSRGDAIQLIAAQNESTFRGFESSLPAEPKRRRASRRASGSPGNGPRLEDDDRGPRRAASRVAIDVVPHLAPSAPEALALVALRRPPMDGARAIGKLDRGVGVRLQVEPPGGLGVFPTIHRHRDQVRTILVIAEDHAALLAGAAAHRGEAHRPPSVRLRRPQASTAPTEPIDRAVNYPGRDNDPAKRAPRRSIRRVGHG